MRRDSTIIDRVLTANKDLATILPRIGPTAYGGEVTEGKQGFEWESNSKHVEDMVELCGLKLESKHKGDGKRTERHR